MAKYNIQTIGAQFMSGYDFGLITPELGMRYLYLWHNQYTDSQDINVNKNSENIVTGIIGIKVAKEIKLDKGYNLVPQFKISGLYDLSQAERYATGMFNNIPQIFNQERMSKFATEINLGIALSKDEVWKTYLGYYGQLRNHYDIHAAMLNFQYNF